MKKCQSVIFIKNPNLVFSRIPVYSNDQNEIDGYVLKDKILESIINKKGDSELSKIKRP